MAVRPGDGRFSVTQSPPLTFMECGGRGCEATGDTALQCRRAPINLRQRTLKENPVWNLPLCAMGNVRSVSQVARAKRRHSRRTPKGANGSFMECGGRGCEATGDTALQCWHTPTILRQRTPRENSIWNLPRCAMLQRPECHPSGARKAASQPPHSKKCERELYETRSLPRPSGRNSNHCSLKTKLPAF
jgi:hypothetical protein